MPHDSSSSSSFCPGGGNTISSPLLTRINRWLVQPHRGVLIRTRDGLEDAQWFQEVEETYHHEPMAYVPASYLHASLRAPIGLNAGQVGHLVATHYKRNLLSKETNSSVDCASYYPTEAQLILRPSALSEQSHGRGCSVSQEYICTQNGTCITSVDTQCACNERIPPHLFGSIYADWTQFVIPTTLMSERRPAGTFGACWFEHTRDMIAASNSLFLERRNWSSLTQEDYRGGTECAASLNILNPSYLDALVLHSGLLEEDPSCELDLETYQEALQYEYEQGFGRLPVLVLVEHNGGLVNRTECRQLWADKECSEGTRKEFLGMEYNFTNGACLVRPDSCEDVFYFPANNRGGCHVTLDPALYPRCLKGSRSSGNQKNRTRAPAVDHPTSKRTKQVVDPTLPPVPPELKTANPLHLNLPLWEVAFGGILLLMVPFVILLYKYRSRVKHTYRQIPKGDEEEPDEEQLE